jgi:protein arginine kinase activator
MECQLCQQREATVHIKQVQDGDVREMHVCAECAAQHGLEDVSPMDLTDFLFGVNASRDEASSPADGKRCPTCGFTGKEFKKRSRLGCARCYEAFAEDVDPMLTSMHRGDQHVGKVPAAERKGFELMRLEQEMATAVQVQDFETAARCRDRIREIGGEPAGAQGDGSVI